MWAKAVFAVKFRNRIRPSSLDALRHLWSSAAAKNTGAASAAAAASNDGGTTTTTTDDRSVPLSVPAVCVWGANTGVGKTLVSAGVVREASLSGAQVAFVKPVQTGYPADSDARLVERAAAAAAADAPDKGPVHAATLFAFREPASPHLAAALEQRSVSDGEVLAATRAALVDFASEVGAGSDASRRCALAVVETAGGVASPTPAGTPAADALAPLRLPALLVGDAALGGISTTLTAYEALLLRGHEVAAVALPAEQTRGNHAALQAMLARAGAHRAGRPLPVVALPPLPAPPSSSQQSSSDSGSDIDAALAAWLEEAAPALRELVAIAEAEHARRLEWLSTAADRARAAVWWPFTQHGSVERGGVTVVDARAGEDWLVFRGGSSSSSSSGSSAASGGPALTPLYDAASSWWTQTAGPFADQGHVVRAAAAAAARYSHVMWPEVAHEPGLRLAEKLLQGPLGAGWAARVFYSDDGSTAVEVALKMAFRRYALDHGLVAAAPSSSSSSRNINSSSKSSNSSSSTSQPDEAAAAAPALDVLALSNAYHGDTLGAMDCAAPSPFNGPLQTPWYSGRGLFLEPPYLSVRAPGRWTLKLPDWLAGAAGKAGGGDGGGSAPSWASQEEAFCPDRDRGTPLAAGYEAAIDAAIDAHEAAADGASNRRRRVGALLIEPVLQGAGGMLVVDPAFQRALVRACRRRGVPVIYDEVFTGCWRLGVPTAGGGVLGLHPDIACYAKLLTGGAAPLAATLAGARVFEAFEGGGKAAALLHGHSYTAYPAGCAAALASLELLSAAHNANACAPSCARSSSSGSGSGGDSGQTAAAASTCRRPGGRECAAPCGRLLPFWTDGGEPSADADAVPKRLSRHPLVAGAVALGTVLAVELRPAAAAAAGGGGGSSGGYLSGGGGSAAVVAGLRRRGVFARPLGPVVYVMATPTTPPRERARVLAALDAALDEALSGGGGGARAAGGDDDDIAIP